MSTETRTYRSELREAQAAQTRVRVLAAAAGEFAGRGYAGTTMAAIARTAGVSVETVKATGSKPELLLSAFELTFAGREGRESIATDEQTNQRLADSPQREWLATVVDLATEMNSRGAGLWVAFTAAAQHDDAVAAAMSALLERRRADFVAIVSTLDEHGLIRNTTPRDELAAVLSFLGSPEGYQQLVTESGWPNERYRNWLLDAIERLVLR